MQLPTISPELTLRFERVWARERLDRMTGVMNHPGNPLAVAIASFGQATAFRAARNASAPWMNRTITLTADDREHVPAILDFYREAGVKGYLELCPATSSPELLTALAEGGAYQESFHTVTYGLPTRELPAPPAGVEVHQIGRAELDLFLETNQIGFGAPTEIAPGLRFWYDLEGWRLYLATVDGTPAGAAILVLADGVGYMASGCTVPAHRGRGVQKALLRQRVADSAREGCDFVFGQCAFGSVSHHNQEICGLRTAYTKAIWVTQP